MSNKETTTQSTPRGSMGARGGPMGGGAPGHMVGSGEKAKNFSGTMKKLINYLKPYRLQIIIVIIFAVASTIFAILSPRMLGNATNVVVDGFINRSAYDQISAKIPQGLTFPANSTIGDVLSYAPPAANTQIQKSVPKDRLDKILSIKLGNRPTIDFNAIKKIAITLIILYLLSAFFSYIQGCVRVEDIGNTLPVLIQ
jgi:ATP-binding cassette subfamily B protein